MVCAVGTSGYQTRPPRKTFAVRHCTNTPRSHFLTCSVTATVTWLTYPPCTPLLLHPSCMPLHTACLLAWLQLELTMCRPVQTFSRALQLTSSIRFTSQGPASHRVTDP